MEDLFSTSIAVNNQSITYRVVFDQEQYVFLSEKEGQQAPAISFRREHDQWVGEEQLSPAVRDQAIDALERYLLKQH